VGTKNAEERKAAASASRKSQVVWGEKCNGRIYDIISPKNLEMTFSFLFSP